MRRLYSLLTRIAAPAAFALVLCRGMRDRSYWQRFGERFGGGEALEQPCIWVHAVSVGGDGQLCAERCAAGGGGADGFADAG